jgi:alkylated DNA repair dioxygenase AlkB
MQADIHKAKESVIKDYQDAKQSPKTNTDAEQQSKNEKPSLIGSDGFQCMGRGLSEADATRIGLTILKAAPFVPVPYRGIVLPRVKAVYVLRDEKGKEPLYRYPGFSYAFPTHDWKDLPILDELVARCEAAHNENKSIHTPFKRPNHAIVTFYLNETHNIGPHSDKTMDISDHSIIYDFSFFATRPIELVHIKRQKKQVKNLIHGSLFMLNPKTNERFTHAIPALDTPCLPRMSVVLRRMKTRIERRENGDVYMHGKKRWDAIKYAARKRGASEIISREEQDKVTEPKTKRARIEVDEHDMIDV